MGIAEKDIFNDIVKCGICKDHKPFHFEMGKQKIMLISFAPTYETLHRPLYFIQRFRKICLALFGDATPTEMFIREFYDPAGNIYWTHYQKCFRTGLERGASHCEPLLKREIEVLDPEIIIILGKETIARLSQDRHPAIWSKPDGGARKVFLTGSPTKETAKDFEEIRKAIKPYIGWVNVECGQLDFSGVNFLDLEYASIELLDAITAGPKTNHTKTNRYENEWIEGIILPNIRAYNLILQIFIYIESNIKLLLEGVLKTRDNIEKRWFSPFRDLMTYNPGDDTPAATEQREAVNNLMNDIDSLHALRNIITHKSGVIDERDREKNLKNLSRLKHLKGVYIYGGNSVFVSREGIDYIFGICDRFKKIYINYLKANRAS